MDFAYTTTIRKTFDEAVQVVQDQIAKAGMRVLHIHDVQQTLAEKSFKREPFKIIEFCSAKDAHQFLLLNVQIGLCMPCKINVYTEDGQTWLAGMRPTVLPQFFPDVEFGPRLSELDAIVRSIVDAVV